MGSQPHGDRLVTNKHVSKRKTSDGDACSAENQHCGERKLLGRSDQERSLSRGDISAKDLDE